MRIDHEKKLLFSDGPNTEAEALYWAHPLVTPVLGRPPANAREAARVLAKCRVSERRKELEREPLTVTLGGSACVCEMDDRTITRLNGIRSSGCGADWKQRDGTFVTLTAIDVTTVFNALVARQQLLFSREAALSAEADRAGDVDLFLERVERFFP